MTVQSCGGVNMLDWIVLLLAYLNLLLQIIIVRARVPAEQKKSKVEN
jgi:hypothetical protein